MKHHSHTCPVRHIYGPIPVLRNDADFKTYYEKEFQDANRKVYQYSDARYAFAIESPHPIVPGLPIVFARTGAHMLGTHTIPCAGWYCGDQCQTLQLNGKQLNRSVESHYATHHPLVNLTAFITSRGVGPYLLKKTYTQFKHALLAAPIQFRCDFPIYRGDLDPHVHVVIKPDGEAPIEGLNAYLECDCHTRLENPHAVFKLHEFKIVHAAKRHWATLAYIAVHAAITVSLRFFPASARYETGKPYYVHWTSIDRYLIGLIQDEAVARTPSHTSQTMRISKILKQTINHMIDGVEFDNDPDTLIFLSVLNWMPLVHEVHDNIGLYICDLIHTPFVMFGSEFEQEDFNRIVALRTVMEVQLSERIAYPERVIRIGHAMINQLSGLVTKLPEGSTYRRVVESEADSLVDMALMDGVDEL